MKFMENYKNYCLCGAVFKGKIPPKHPECNGHKIYISKNPTVTNTYKFICVCGSIISENGLKTHLNTVKHTTFIAKQKTENLINFDLPKPLPEPILPAPILPKVLQKKENLIDFNLPKVSQKKENLMDFNLPKTSQKEKRLSRGEKKDLQLDRETLMEIEKYLDDQIKDRNSTSTLEDRITSSSDKINCGCGSVISRSGYKKHLTTKKHKEYESKN
jgi:hypothetical protein